MENEPKHKPNSYHCECAACCKADVADQRQRLKGEAPAETTNAEQRVKARLSQKYKTDWNLPNELWDELVCYESELAQLRAEVERLKESNKELNHLFDLQHTRTTLATKLWRSAHPDNDLVIPDLGTLIDWLLHVRQENACLVGEQIIRAYQDVIQQAESKAERLETALREIPQKALNWSNNLAEEWLKSRQRIRVYGNPQLQHTDQIIEVEDLAKKFASECLANVHLIQEAIAREAMNHD